MSNWDIGDFGRVIAADGAYRVLVEGAARGIGLATAAAPAGFGPTVTLADRDGDGATTVAEDIQRQGGQALALHLDVTAAGQVADRVATRVRAGGSFHAMVDATGVTGVTEIPGHLVSPEDFDLVVEINLRGTLVLTQAVLPGMLAAGFGRILHVASNAGKEGNAVMEACSATKAGLIGLAKSMALDCATSSVTINALAAAVIQTPLVAALPEATVSCMTARIPMARTGTLGEAPRMAGFAISPACGFTIGFTFDLSGGRATYWKGLTVTEDLRSAGWFKGSYKGAYFHRSWMKNQGFPSHLFDGRPVIGICNSWSELTPCNAHLRDLADFAKRGVYEAGGFPVAFPVMSLVGSNLRPAAMLYRNRASMNVEEPLRANPIDGVVLLVGCDKTTPALVMGAASCNLPTIAVSGGPMLSGTFRGEKLGSGADMFRLSEEVKAGLPKAEDFLASEAAMSRSTGSCNAMDAASTMACMMEALGLALPGNAAIPAVDARRRVLSQMSGQRIVAVLREGLRIRDVVTRRSCENAIRVNGEVGGSTNAVIHLSAIAGRLGIDLGLEDRSSLGKGVTTLVDLMPSGRFLMEDFFAAGGLPPLMRRLIDAGNVDGSALAVSGRTQAEAVAGEQVFQEAVIRGFDNPIAAEGGIAVLRGNLAPSGAVLKPSAASPHLMQHEGAALVFDPIEDYHARINDPALEVDETTVMVLRNCGPLGYPGMPEVANMGLPPKLFQRGVKDMVRISDARMSGTAYGTVVLHAAPEAAIGGQLALIRTGDRIRLDVPGRSLSFDLSDAEPVAGRTGWTPPDMDRTGFLALFRDHVMQADRGCDFDFLHGPREAGIPRVFS